MTVAWREEDRLRFDYSFAEQTAFGAFTDVSRFHGNVAAVSHGREVTVTFRPPGAVLAPGERALEATQTDDVGRRAGARSRAWIPTGLCCTAIRRRRP